MEKGLQYFGGIFVKEHGFFNATFVLVFWIKTNYGRGIFSQSMIAQVSVLPRVFEGVSCVLPLMGY